MPKFYCPECGKKTKDDIVYVVGQYVNEWVGECHCDHCNMTFILKHYGVQEDE